MAKGKGGKDNLIPGGHKLTLDEQKAGGIASGIARRKKKDFREACIALLEAETTDEVGNIVTGYDIVINSMFVQAKLGNVKAFEALRDTAGQKPVDKVVVADVDQSVINEVESIVAGATAAGTAADIDIDDVTDDASSSARDDAPAFPPQSAPVAGIVASEQTATTTKKKRATKKKATTDVSTDDSPFFDLGDDAT